jgi:hypothetical protein
MDALERVRTAWLRAGKDLVNNDGISRVMTCPGVRNGVVGMHCLIYVDAYTLWPDIAMSDENVYQQPVLRAIKALANAVQPLFRQYPDVLAYMPSEPVAIAMANSELLAACRVRNFGPCTVPTANLSTVWSAADDAWIEQMSEDELRQVFMALDPWARYLGLFGFYNPGKQQHWLNFMVVPEKPLSLITDNDLVATVTSSQPGWNFVRGDHPRSFIPNIREILSIMEERGFGHNSPR